MTAGKIIAAAVSAALLLTGCSLKGEEEEEKNTFDSAQAFAEDFDGVTAAGNGPQLSISSTSGKAGDTVKVTISVQGMEKNWETCGLHIVYPDVLKCIYSDEEQKHLEFTTGSACETAAAVIAREWTENLPEELLDDDLGALFFTAVMDDESGTNGDIATFSFHIPENADAGTVYNIDFYYFSSLYSGDSFVDADNDRTAEKYAFEHWQGGTVTVEE